MDPFTLSEKEMDKILFINEITITGLTQLQKDNLVSELFDDPYQLIDFYIASHTEISRNVTYTLDSINNLTNDEKEELSRIFLLNPNAENFIERLERILRYLGLILEPFGLDIYLNIIKDFDYKELKKFYISLSLKDPRQHDYFWKELLMYKYGAYDLIESLNAEMTYLAKEIFKKDDVLKIVEDKIVEILSGVEEIYFESQIGNEGAKALAEVLKINIPLKILVIRTSFMGGVDQIGEEGAIAIAEALIVNKVLLSFTIENNNIGDGGAKAFATVLKVNKSLEKLWIGDNYIKKDGAEAIAEALKFNKSLRSLNISDNKIGDKGAKAFAKLLKVNKFLRLLDLTYNEIGDKGAIEIAKALKVNTSLRELYMTRNNIGYEGEIAIEEALEDNKSLLKILVTQKPWF